MTSTHFGNMIKNDRQYKITKAQAEKFARALRNISRASVQGIHPALAKAQLEATKSQYEELQQELKEYEELKGGKRKTIRVNSFERLPVALIQARIARGLTQKKLAQKLGLKEQQIQRYEASSYAKASLARINQIIEVLDIKIGSKVDLTNGGAISASIGLRG
ncbi:helix-turn-helix transcriptional regulator [candidate division KSB1 bacterium]|nr:helix-turn-helix transcriptional regulator [candidate division KSB1 bacterium]